jgi:hypothetical protein
MALLNWSNALSAAGGATARLGLEGVRATLEQEKIELASALAEKRQIGAEQRAPGVAAATTTATADAQAAATIRNAPGLLGVKAMESEAVLKAKLKEFEALAPLQRQAAIDTEVAKVKALATPEMLAAVKSIEQAKHIVDPQYSLMPQADGTVVAVNARNPKDTKVLQDADGKPLVRKDPEEMKAAVAVINLSNTNLRIAEAAYKADSASLEPGVKEKATIAWEAAQREAKMMTAPAYAVLYGKAKIPGVAPEAPAGKTGWDPATGEVWKNGEKLTGKAKSAAEASSMIHSPAAPAKPKEEPTTHIPPGGIDPNVALNERRRAAIREAEEKELEEARQKRLAAKAESDASVGLMNRLSK